MILCVSSWCQQQNLSWGVRNSVPCSDYKTLAIILRAHSPWMTLCRWILSFIWSLVCIWSHASLTQCFLLPCHISVGQLLTLKLYRLLGLIISVLYWSGPTSLQTKSINLKRKPHCNSNATIHSLHCRKPACIGIKHQSLPLVCFGSCHYQLSISLLSVLIL